MSNATFSFGRFNPPTEEGHGKLVSAVQKHAEETSGKHYIFPTKSQDKKKNPMSHEDKVHAMKKLFPTAHIASHKDVHTVIDAVKHLEKQGHTHVTMVAGSDRVEGFHKLLHQYKDKEFPKIKKISVVSAGHRDPDAEGAEGMSASKLRGLVAAGKKKEFVSHYSDPKLGAHIHDKVKEGMQMKESVSPVGIFLLGGPGSGKDYVLKNIFSRFDLTEVQADQLVNGAAAELYEGRKNIVINGVADAEKISIIQSILEGYDFDYVHVAVTNKVSRIRNEQRDQPLSESKRIEKFLKAEKLSENYDCFRFNNSINLNESTEMEQVLFGGQIEKLLERVVNLGLEIKSESEPKLFMALKEQVPMSAAQIQQKKFSDMRKTEKDRRVRDTRVLTHQNAHIHAAAKGSMSEEKGFPSVKHDKESGLPKKYVAGLGKSTAKARAAHWKEKDKLSDSDPRAYEPAPGDATAKTKLSKYTKKYHDMYGEASSPAQQAAIAIAMKKAGKTPKNEEVELDEGAADTSLSAKASKSGISVGTLRKVYNRGVAAWNSGHRPGTTPQQWGHARVNSYITKGKTYHTADKDLHEDVEQDIDALFEMQLVGTDSYRDHALSTTPGQSIEEPLADKNSCVCGGSGECQCEVTPTPTRTFKDLRKEATDSTVDIKPELSKSSIKKKRLVAAPRGLDSTMQGLPVSSRFTAFESKEEQIDEISSKPPSAAKRLKNFLKTPLQIPPPKGGHPVPPGYERVHDVFSGGTVLRKLKESPELTLEEAVQYHLDNQISFTENVFRPASEMFFDMISEAKRLYKEGTYTPADEWEKDLLESDIGEIAEYEGQTVVLDYPIEEGLEKCWTGYTQKGMKKKGDKMVPNCVPVSEDSDPTGGKGIGKPWRSNGGGAVYVRTGNGGVKKVNFSQSGMTKKFMDPAATRSFVARHHCLTNKDKTSASYWACRYPRFFSNSGKLWW